MTETDRNLGRQWFEQVWNQKRREAIAEMPAPDAVVHDGGSDRYGPEGLLAEGDKMCVRG